MRTSVVAAASAAIFLLAGCSGCDPAEPRYAVSGTVTRAWGGALPGVTVTLAGAAGGTAVTDASGRYSFAGLAEGAYTVTPALAGWAFAPSAPSLTLSGGDATQDFTADGARTISGQVTTAWGAPLEDASVALAGGGVAKAPVLTDVAGLYSFRVPDGSYTLSADRPGYEITPVDPTVVVSGADETQDFSADGAYAISGHVTAAWGPALEHASVALSGGGVAKAPASSDATGLYSIRVPDGTYTLSATLPGYALAPVDPIVVVSGASETQDFSGDGAYTISGTVATAWSTALPGASVALSGGGVVKAPVLTDAGGGYSFHVPDGTFTLTPTLAGWEFTPPDPSVVVSGASRAQSFTADGAYTISGTITTAWGSALAGASVALSSASGVTKPPVATDAAGFYSFKVPNGTYALTPTLDGYQFWSSTPPSFSVDGASTTVHFTADGAYAISGTVTGPVKQGVSIALSGGSVVKSPAITGPDGAYAFSGIPNGSYVLTPSLAGYEFTPPDPTVVVSGQSATQDFESYVPTYAIRGTVRDGFGAGLAGMTVRLGGASAAVATTDALGDYAFTGLTGSQRYTVNLTTFGWQAFESYDTVVTADVSGADFAAMQSGATAITYTGSIAYGGARTGPVYVTVEWQGSGGAAGGTGLPRQAGAWTEQPFEIRGAQVWGGFTIRAWMDTLGLGRFHAGADPSVTYDGYAFGSIVDVGPLTLVDPPAEPVIASPVAVRDVLVGDGIAAVLVDGPRDASGGEVADSYRVYWNTSATVDSTNHLGSVLVPAGAEFGLVHGLANGTPYWFAAEAYLAASPLPGQLAVTPTSFTPGATAGSATVSGTVTHPAVPAPSALYVVAVAGKGPAGAHLVRIADPASTATAYSMSLAEGTYQLFAFVDVGDDGAVTAGEPARFPDDATPQVTLVAGANAQDLSIPSGNGFVRLATSRWTVGTSSWTSLAMGVASNERIPLAARVTGPCLVGPVDLAVSRDGGSSVSLNSSYGTEPILPFVGDTYTFAITYADGTEESVTRTISGLFGSPPTIVAPADGAIGVSLVPTFEWTAPSGAPGPYSYRLQVWPRYGNDSAWETFLPAGVTTVAYDADGTARAPLSPFTAYQWLIRAVDEGGNEASYQASFDTAAAPLDLYDPLDATTLDASRWQTPQFTRSISGGQAMLWVAADGMLPRLDQGITYSNTIPVLAGGARVTTFQVDVTVPAGTAVRSGTAKILGGLRLLYQPQLDRGYPFPAQNANFLTAALEVFDGGAGPQLRRRFYHCDDAACVTLGNDLVDAVDPPEFTPSGVDAVAPASFDATYTVSISLDEAAGVFAWSVQGGEYAVPLTGTADVSRWVASKGMDLATTNNGFSSAQLIARTFDDEGGSSGSVAATFDNVMIGTNGRAATLWDDFETMGSSATFSPARWSAPAVDSDVWLAAGPSRAALHLRSEVTTAATGSRVATGAVLARYPNAFREWQADVTIVAEQPAGVAGSGNSVFLAGAFFHDGTVGATGAVGDVRARVLLFSMGASYQIFRCNNRTCGGTTLLKAGGLFPGTRPFGVGTLHTLRVGWDPSARRLRFSVDDGAEMVEDPMTFTTVGQTTPLYPFHSIETSVGIGGSGAGVSASIEAAVNDVRAVP